MARSAGRCRLRARDDGTDLAGERELTGDAGVVADGVFVITISGIVGWVTVGAGADACTGDHRAASASLREPAVGDAPSIEPDAGGAHLRRRRSARLDEYLRRVSSDVAEPAPRDSVGIHS